MQFNRKKKDAGNTDVVVTSLLDVNFLLIMFFLMTAQFQRDTHATLNLPQEKGEEKAPPDEAGLVINVTAQGEIVVSNATVSIDALRDMVRQQVDNAASRANSSSKSSVLKLMIRADRDASTQDLNRVVLMLREMGVSTIRIATVVPKS